MGLPACQCFNKHINFKWMNPHLARRMANRSAQKLRVQVFKINKRQWYYELLDSPRALPYN
jgi:hypothetical protein